METVLFTSGGYSFRADFTDFGLARLSWVQPSPERKQILSGMAKELKTELDEYFAGSRKEFSIPLDLDSVTEFQFKVYEQLLMVPWGKTASYADIAERVGCPKGTRAIGGANSKNPISILIPCHRVIKSDGSIGGYSGTIGIGPWIDVKTALLKIEGQKF